MRKSLLVLSFPLLWYSGFRFVSREPKAHIAKPIKRPLVTHFHNISWKYLPRTKLLLYSAYAERGDTKALCHVERLNVPKNVVCSCNVTNHDWYRAKIEVLPEHHNYPYSACFLNCPCQSERLWLSTMAFNTISKFKSVHLSGERQGALHLPIQSKPESSKSFQLSICVKPMHSEISAESVWEFINYYRLFGVQLFTFYNYNAPKSVLDLLEKIAPNDSEVYNWDLPLKSWKDVHTAGIIGAINECVMRRRRDSEFVIEGEGDFGGIFNGIDCFF